VGKKILDYDGEYPYLTASPKSHVPMGVRRSSKWWGIRYGTWN